MIDYESLIIKYKFDRNLPDQECNYLKFLKNMTDMYSSIIDGNTELWLSPFIEDIKNNELYFCPILDFDPEGIIKKKELWEIIRNFYFNNRNWSIFFTGFRGVHAKAPFLLRIKDKMKITDIKTEVEKRINYGCIDFSVIKNDPIYILGKRDKNEYLKNPKYAYKLTPKDLKENDIKNSNKRFKKRNDQWRYRKIIYTFYNFDDIREFKSDEWNVK